MNDGLPRAAARIELEPGSKPLVGELIVDGENRWAFSGWMGLATAVEAWRQQGLVGDGGAQPERLPAPNDDPD